MGRCHPESLLLWCAVSVFPAVEFTGACGISCCRIKS